MSKPLTVAIFGATSAVAQAVARRYAARGARLALIGRSADKLAQLTRELRTHVVFERAQDFCDAEQTRVVVAELLTEVGELDIVLVAHGLLGNQLLSERDPHEADEIARVNYLSVQNLLIPLANALEQRGRGQLAVITSVAAERGRPRNYTYAAAKAALNVYPQGLRSRLYPSGVTVHTLKLGPVDTPMTATHTKNVLFSSADSVARHIERALARGTAEAFVPPFWALIMPVVRTMPEAVFQRIGSLSGR